MESHGGALGDQVGAEGLENQVDASGLEGHNEPEDQCTAGSS